MATVTVDLRDPGTHVTGDQVRAIAAILGLDHVEFTDIQRIDITPTTVTVTALHRDEDGHAHTRDGESPVIATVTMTMPVRWA